MAQSFIAGTTDYSEQSIQEIRNDILSWIEYSQRIKTFFTETIKELKKTKYWYKIGYDFANFCESMPLMCDAFCNDFNLIVKAIDDDNITKREIKLMKNIRKCIYENEEFCWKTYKGHENERWHEYGNPEFEKVEKLYADGRDFLVSLKDAGNACSRMEDYIKEDGVKMIKIEDNSINIGDKNKIRKSQIGNKNATKKEDGFFYKYPWQIISGVIVVVLAAAICTWLGLK